MANATRNPGLTRAVLVVGGFRCRYCGKTAETADHIIPRHLRGADRAFNLVACCWVCNGAKGARRLLPDIENELLLEAFIVAEFVEQIAASYADAQSKAIRRRRAPIALRGATRQLL